MFQTEWLSVIGISYLLGAIPTAYLIGLLRGRNIFEIGSGNMGATNAVRGLGLGWGILVWLLDTLKGVAAILIARQLMPDALAAASAVAAVMAIIGHNWSVIVAVLTGKLRGGKGASIAFASLILIAPNIVGVVGLIGLSILIITRYVSLSVLVMVAVATLWMIVLVNQRLMAEEYIYYALCTAALILYRFRENIQRLLTGTERRLGERV